MGFSDKTIQCVDCQTAFIFSAQEQEFFASKGYTNEPKRCPACRKARRMQQGSVRPRAERQMFAAKCAECGKDTQIPFEPREGRPVYCSDCYSRIKVSK